MFYRILAKPITESIDDYLNDVGIDDAFSQVMLVVGLIVVFSILLHKIRAPYTVIMLVNTLIFIIAIVLGMLPVWIILMVFFVVFAYILLVMFDLSPNSSYRKER